MRKKRGSKHFRSLEYAQSETGIQERHRQVQQVQVLSQGENGTEKHVLRKISKRSSIFEIKRRKF